MTWNSGRHRGSADSIVASAAVASARPDGHTLLLMSNGNAVSVALFKTLPYDTLKAFAPVGMLGVRAQPGTRPALQGLLASEIKRWGTVVRAAKMEAE